MQKQNVIVNHPVGLHARPASVFVQLAQSFKSNISVSSNGRSVNAKSLLGLLGLGVTKGSEIIIQAEGVDEDDVIKQLVSLVMNNFNE